MPTINTSSQTLDNVRAIAADIAANAEQGELDRCLVPSVVEQLKEAGIFRMLVPKKFGGDELSVSQACAVIEELGAADAAAAWTAMVAFGFNVALAKFPEHVVSELYANGPDVMIRGALAPIGKAIATDGGYVLSGKWPFASGPYTPDWMVAGAIVIKDGAPIMTPMGPEMVVSIIPTDKVTFLDTWHSVGMCGSDSRDYTVEEVFVPEDHATNLFNFMSPQCYDVPLFDQPFPIITGPTHSAVCLGIVRGALAELAELSKTKKSAFDPTMILAQNPIFQHSLAELSVRHAALEALVEKQNAIIDSETNFQLNPMVMAKNSSWTGYVHVEAVDIVNKAFGLAGSTPVYKTSTLQRRLRDVRVAAQHFGGSTAQYPALGAMLAGQEPPMPGGKK